MIKKFLSYIISLLMIVSFITSCSPQAATPVAEPTEAAPAVTEAAPAVTEPITIEYWENFIGSSAAQNWAIEQIKAKYPNLTINSVNYQIEDMEVKLPTALASGTGPDIVYADMNPKWLGRFVNAGLAIPLTEGVEKYGWDEKIFEWAQEFGTYNGELYGIGHEFEVLGLFYNKKIFEELGLEVPKTQEELEAVMEKVKNESDYVPMFYGCGEGCPNGIHMYNAIAYSIVPVPKVLAATPLGDGSYLDPEWKQALQVLEKWEKAGYFNEDALDYTWEGHWSGFCNGEVAMLAQGSWLFKTISDCAAENPDLLEVGWAAFPVPEGKPFQAYVGVGSGWWLSSNLKDDQVKREIALEFLDLLISDEAVYKWVTEDQIFPAVKIDPAEVPLTEPQATSLEVAEMAGRDGGGPIPICWNNSSEETDVWVNDFQALWLGQIDLDTIVNDVDTVLKKYQAEWQENQ